MEAPEGWVQESVRANGVILNYYRTGSGPPVIMAHALFNDASQWFRLGDDLAEANEVIAYDARGHGNSDAPVNG